MAVPNGVQQNQQRNVTAPPAPIHEAPRHLTPATAPEPKSLPPTPPPKQQASASMAAPGKPMSRMAPIPPPVIVPPRQSSLARGPEQQQPELEESYHQRQASLSDPSSVVVTPTTSMATNSSPSLFEVRPAAMRDDCAASGSEAGYESAVSDASGKPRRSDVVPTMVAPGYSAPGYSVAAH